MKPLTLIGSTCIILGIFFLGRKQRKGWIFQFSGSFLSIIHFWFIAYDPSVVVLNCILAGLAGWSWWKWSELVKGQTLIRFLDWWYILDLKTTRELPRWPERLCARFTHHRIIYVASGTRCRCGLLGDL